MKNYQPMGRMGEPDELARAISFLANGDKYLSANKIRLIINHY